ncbi:putative zinc finger protein [Daldinia childiae]|uniref:putative zinc finger protein n=1 Tax=Daldinia childiae TaxID=326645 RepID=UPI001445B9D6|nr:putative zinc finger protein [Daldinia childiae]KAF3064255.1 putative zinc finger protein [Daldinia childiae]
MAWKCRDCNRSFARYSAREQHLNALDHRPLNFECRCCYNVSSSEETRQDHEAEVHFYCHDCDRDFQNYNNIKMHLNSRFHRKSRIACPFCKADYTTATGLTHHLEGGHCPQASFLNRDEIFRVVRAKDPTGILSKKLIGWHGSSTYEASDQTWNGHAFECYFCHRDFVNLHALNQHLNSPAHQQSMYHCPNRNACGRDFKSLAAVMNHLESESCAFTRFENVQRAAINLISGDRRLTFG